jgi:dihydrofolate synthase / folylpolyglutamate synthase
MPSQPENQQPNNRVSGASSDPAVEDRLEAILQRLYGFYNVEIDLSLHRTYRFMEALGNPHLRLPRVVHVAGTNGKGSTIATLRALLEASGHSVHVYTSPHLVHPTERIRLAGELIRSEALIDLLTECIDINKDEPITFF